MLFRFKQANTKSIFVEPTNFKVCFQ